MAGTMETFWRTIGLYNSATWIGQLLIMAVGILQTIWLIKKPGRWSIICMKIFLIAIYIWIAIVYFHIYCAERGYNNIMTIFWILLAISWIWDLFNGYTTFKRNYKYTKTACLLLFMPFMYPVVSLLRGMTFPYITSPVMPCSVVVFTIGLLLMFSRKINLFIVLLLCHWSVIGLSKTIFYNIPEDYLLVSASIPAIYIFFRDYYLTNNDHTITKPQTKYIKWLFAAICICLGATLIFAMLSSLFIN